MQYVNRFLFSEHNKEKTVGAAIPRAEEQFADGLIERDALGSHGATLGVVRQAFRSLTRAPDPISRCAGCLAADVAIGCLEIIFRSGGNDDAVGHLSVRVFAFQVVKHVVCRSTHAFAGLR